MHKLLKHIDTKNHFLREKVNDSSIHLLYTPTDQLAADLLTKALPEVKVEQHSQKLLRQMLILPPTNGKSEKGVEYYNLELLELQNLNFSLTIAQMGKKQTNLMIQQSFWVSVSDRIDFVTSGKLFVHDTKKLDTEQSSQTPKLQSMTSSPNFNSARS